MIMKIVQIEEQIGCATNRTWSKKAKVPSDEEVAALDDMREIKVRVRELKKRLSDDYCAEKSRLEREMAALKVEWDELDKERKKAARDRMILLGHETI
jgi:hypothetical protein